MSLQVWLPLNDTLENQGLSNVTVTNNSATVDNNGKIGKCYNFNGSNNYISIPSNVAQNLIGEFSISFWVNFNSFNTSYQTVFSATSSSASWANEIICFQRNSTGSTFLFTIANNSSATQASLQTGTLVVNTWYHFVCIYQTGKISIYQDGVLVNSYNTSIVPNVSVVQNFQIGRSHTGYYSNMKLNDFRVYDYALSAKEVKELSKGLVLHYKLDGGTSKILPPEYQEVEYLQSSGTQYINTGYIANTYPLQLNAKISWLSAPSSEKDFWGNYNNTSTSGSSYCFVCGGRSTDKWYQWGGSVWDPIADLAINTIYDTSFTYIGATGRTANVNGTVVTTTSSNNNALAATDGYIGLFSGAGARAYCCGSWKIYHASIIHEGNMVRNFIPCYRISDNVAGMYDTITQEFFTNVGTGTFTLGPIVYKIDDCSGYKHNGRIYSYDSNGTIENSFDSPRYNNCTYINSSDNTTNTASGTKYIYGDLTLTTPNQLSVAFWCKPIAGYGNGTNQGQFCTTNLDFGSNAGNDYQASCFNHRDGQVDVNSSDGSTHKAVSINFTANEWHHYVIIYNGQGALVYKDGVQQTSTSFSAATSLCSMKGVIIGFSKAGGVWRSNKSYYSDFRLYTTALSADDVKELYQTAASTDNHGNVYAYELEEV